MRVLWRIGWVAAGMAFLTAQSLAEALPETEYWLYVAAESEDQVALLSLGPEGFQVEKTIPVGVRPTEIEGAHGLRVSPDGEYWYVSIAHGNPFGWVHKYRTETDEWEAAAEVGMFPATIDVAASTGLLWVANFDLHGEMKPGTISVVDTENMHEVSRVQVGIMPHGSRLNESEDRHYAVMMMSGELVETSAWSFEVLRRLPLTESRSPAMGTVKPTWVEPSPDGTHLWIALNGANQILEVDIPTWSVRRRFPTPAGPYNIGLSADGHWLVVTYKTDGSTGIWDLEKGVETARIRNSTSLPHGVQVSPDSRYAFVSVEGVGGEPGRVDAIDIAAGQIVASVQVGKQASGIAFWKMGE